MGGGGPAWMGSCILVDVAGAIGWPWPVQLAGRGRSHWLPVPGAIGRPGLMPLAPVLLSGMARNSKNCSKLSRNDRKP